MDFIDQVGAATLEIAPTARIEAPIRLRGQGHRLVLEDGASVTAFAPAGFAATVPDATGPARVAIDIEGEDNEVIVRSSARLAINLTVRGRGQRVEIGEGCLLHGFVNLLGEGGARLIVGDRTTMVQGSLQLHEPGEIRIGADCMISSQVYVSLSDIHPIYDRSTGARINPAASVSIGDHVWLGLRCMVMKGAKIGDGAIIAAGALASGVVPAHCVAAGLPAKVVRENVDWRRDFDEAPTLIDRPMRRRKFLGVF
jgi:acetyltransferase-like isoleucine patch superfamily enzyme